MGEGGYNTAICKSRFSFIGSLSRLATHQALTVDRVELSLPRSNPRRATFTPYRLTDW